MERAEASREGVVDYDVHGIVGIRLFDASAGDEAGVDEQLGMMRKPLAREPEIRIRFVDRLPVTSTIRYLGDDEVGFTDDQFLVMRGRGGTRLRAHVAFGQIGDTCELVCESGLARVPLLIPILNLAMLGRGLTPLHASAFAYNGTGVLVTGWARGGKTTSLLAFMAHGADYIGDDWVYVSANGERLYGIPNPITVRDWHLRDLPQFRKLVGRRDRSRLSAVSLLYRAHRLLDGVRPQPRPGRRLATRGMALLEGQLSVEISPEHLFGRRSCSLAGDLQKVFLSVSHERPDVRVEPIDSDELAHRLAFVLRHERLGLLSYYLKFRFAFPAAANTLLDQADDLDREALSRIFKGKDAYVIYHPYPAPISAIFDAVSPHLA